MMTLSDAVAAFTENDVPVAHVRFRGNQAPPYAEAYLNDSEYFSSDDGVSRTLCNYDMALYVRTRDLTLEAAIEDALAESGITWRKTGGYDAKDDLVMTTYQMQVYER